MKYLAIAVTAFALSTGGAKAVMVELSFQGAGWFAEGVFASELQPFVGDFDQSVNPVTGRFVFDTNALRSDGATPATASFTDTGVQPFLGEVHFGSVSQTVQYPGSVSTILLEDADLSAGGSGDILWITISDSQGDIFAPTLSLQLAGPDYLGVGASPVNLDVQTLQAFVDAFNADAVIAVGGLGSPLRTNANALTQGFKLDPVTTNYGAYEYVVTSLSLDVLPQAPSTSVPIAASLPLLATGMSGIGFLARRKTNL